MANRIITIARSYGSGGRSIGKMLAERMEIPYYDRNLIYIASQRSGMDLKSLLENDEDIKHSAFSGIPSENKKYVSKDDLFNCQADIIRDVSKRSDCVIIGRCADYLLKNSGHKLIRVFIWADEDYCIRSVMEKFSISRQEASKTIKQINKHRYDYYKYHTGANWDCAKNYDLCFDSSTLTYEQIIRSIQGYAEIMDKRGVSLSSVGYADI